MELLERLEHLKPNQSDNVLNGAQRLNDLNVLNRLRSSASTAMEQLKLLNGPPRLDSRDGTTRTIGTAVSYLSSPRAAQEFEEFPS